MVGVGPARTITIIPSSITPITNDPNAATIEATINAAITIYENVITDPITVNIEYREMTTPGLGENSTYLDPVPYQSFYDALVSHATSTNDAIAISHLPNTVDNPVDGSPTINLQLPDARALGFNIIPPTANPDGTVSLNTSIMNLSRASTDPTKYDLISTVMHETDEVLGFGWHKRHEGQNGNPPTGAVWPMDLFRRPERRTQLLDFRQHDGLFFDQWHDRPGAIQSARRGRFQRFLQLSQWRQSSPRARRLRHARRNAQLGNRVHGLGRHGLPSCAAGGRCQWRRHREFSGFGAGISAWLYQGSSPPTLITMAS